MVSLNTTGRVNSLVQETNHVSSRYVLMNYYAMYIIQVSLLIFFFKKVCLKETEETSAGLHIAQLCTSHLLVGYHGDSIEST